MWRPILDLSKNQWGRLPNPRRVSNPSSAGQRPAAGWKPAALPLHTIVLLIGGSLVSHAQTTVYLRSSPPASVQINGATNTTPIVISTGQWDGTPIPHGFATTCGTSTTCYAVVAGLCANDGPAAGNGIRKVTYVDSTHLSLQDLSGANVAGNGAWCKGDVGGFSFGGAQWVGQLTPYTLAAPPVGWLDGPTGDLTRRVSLGPANGLTSITTTGCPSACVVTVVTGYDPTSAANTSFPITAGNRFSITGTGTSLDTCGDGSQNAGAQSPYTMASVSAAGWVSTPFSCGGLANTDYTNINLHCGPAPAPDDTIGGTQSCTRVSQMAYAGNGWWTGLKTMQGTTFDGGTTAYKSVFDGGTTLPGYAWTALFGAAAVRFLVDPTSSFFLNEGLYALNHPEREDGVSWTLYGAIPGLFPGGYLTSQYAGINNIGLSILYSVFAPYWAPGEKTVFRNKIFNNLDDPSVAACATSGPDLTGHNDILASGAAQGGDATHITLAASDTAASGHYVGSAIMLGSTAPYAIDHRYGTVTAYNNVTKVATIGASWTGIGGTAPPAAGTPYTIFSGGIISNAGDGATATITGSNTTFTSSLHVGDGIFLSNDWPQYASAASAPMSYVAAIIDDTHISVMNAVMVGVGASTSQYQQVWYIPAWSNSRGDCGRKWALQHAVGYPGSEPVIQTPDGGAQLLTVAGISAGGNTAWIGSFGDVALDLAMAQDDPRAVRDLAIQQSYLFDYAMRHYMNYSTGFEHSGASYSKDAIFVGISMYLWLITHSVPGYPSMDNSGPWVAGMSMEDMFTTRPDTGDGNPWILGWGSNDALLTFSGHNDTMMNSMSLDPMFLFAPQSDNAKYLRNYLENLPGYSRWGFEGVTDFTGAQNFLHNDPRIPSADYKVQPHQYVFNKSSAARCATLTGWPCPATFRGDAMVSRTGWSSPTDSQLYFGSKTFWNDYDGPESTVRLYKVGDLLGYDYAIQGFSLTGWDPSVWGDTPAIGAAPTKFGAGGLDPRNVYGGTLTSAPIIRWASANHGSWAAQYGDQNSNYVYACSDVSGYYDQATIGITIDHMLRCVAHFKKSGKDEFVLQLDDYGSSATPMSYHVHYPQNGQPHTQPSRTSGTTTCPGTGGCASLNTNRLIQSVEDGRTWGTAPAQTFGLMSHFDSPGTITLQDDCVGHAGGQCAPGDTYPGGLGYSHRVTIAGGSPVGASVTSFTALAEHKVMQSLTDTTLTTTALNPDPHWTGVQACGSISCVVFLGALGGTTRATIAGFTTTHSGTAQYLLGGLAPGTYTVTINSVAVPGSPFTVAANDNSIEFENTAGAVMIAGSAPVLTLTPGSLSFSCVSGGSNPAAQTMSVGGANVVLDNWSASKTKSWLMLSPAAGNAAGSITASVNCAGQPVGIQTDTITVASTTSGIVNSPQTAAVSLTVSPGPSTAVSGSMITTGNVTIH